MSDNKLSENEILDRLVEPAKEAGASLEALEELKQFIKEAVAEVADEYNSKNHPEEPEAE